MAEYSIRLATAEDLPGILTVAASADAKFNTIPEMELLFAGLGDSESSYLAVKIQESLDQGRLFLAEHGQTPVGFLGAYQKDTALYIAEISVNNDYNGKGIGTMLLQAVFDWARERARANGEDEARVSLTAYEQVPWNGPWYQRRGFKKVGAEEVGPKHVAKMKFDREVRDLERPGFTRCCMLWREKLESGEIA